MPVGIAKLLKVQQQERTPVWVLGYRTASGISKPIVFHKPAGGTWEVVYTGDDLPTGDEVTFSLGVRNPGDDPGVISVRCDYIPEGSSSVNGGNVVLRNSLSWARSTDAGASWSFPGVTTSVTNVLNEGSTQHGVPEFLLYPSPDVRVDASTLWSFEPGSISTLGMVRTGFVTSGIVDYYTFDLCILSASEGGPLTQGATIANVVNYDNTYNPFTDFAFYSVGHTGLVGTFPNHPRAFYPSPKVQSPESVYLGLLILTNGVNGVGHVPFYQHVTISGAGAGLTTSLPFDFLTQNSPRQTAFWDGSHWYVGAKSAIGGTQEFIRSANADGPWTEIYTGGTTAFEAAAARRPRQLVVSGKGVTLNGGETWLPLEFEASTMSFDAIGYFAPKYYGIVGSNLYSSRDGVTWLEEELPSVTGLSGLLDVFGG